MPYMLRLGATGAAAVTLLGASLALADHPSVNLGIGPGGPVNTVPATTLPEGSWSIGVRTEHTEFDTLSDGTLSRLREERPEADIHSVENLTSISVSGSVGVTDDFMVGFTLPYIERRNIREAEHGQGGHGHGTEEESGHDAGGDEGPPEVENLGDSNGIGDLKLFGQYRFFQDAATGSHLAGILGVKTPTGRTEEESREGERLETELQPGSGSWDPLFGAAASRRVGPWGFDLSLLYQLATEGDQDADLGDVFSYNAAASYRIMGAEDDSGHDGHSHSEHSHMGVDLVLELNGEWRDKEEVNGQEDDNSGGNQLFLAPGVRASGQGWAASLSAGVPVVDDLNGVQVDPRWRVVGGLSVGF